MAITSTLELAVMGAETLYGAIDEMAIIDDAAGWVVRYSCGRLPQLEEPLPLFIELEVEFGRHYPYGRTLAAPTRDR